MTRGPIPKRDAERRRRNKHPDGVETITVDLSESLAESVEIPAPPLRVDKETGEVTDEYAWDPIAVQWYLSLTRSGQAIFYEPSDWQTAYLLADQISKAMQPVPVQSGTDENGNPTFTWLPQAMNGSQLTALLKGMSSLMTTEGERRRLRIELDRAKIREGATEGNVIPITQERNDRFKDAR